MSAILSVNAWKAQPTKGKGATHSDKYKSFLRAILKKEQDLPKPVGKYSSLGQSRINPNKENKLSLQPKFSLKKSVLPTDAPPNKISAIFSRERPDRSPSANAKLQSENEIVLRDLQVLFQKTGFLRSSCNNVTPIRTSCVQQRDMNRRKSKSNRNRKNLEHMVSSRTPSFQFTNCSARFSRDTSRNTLKEKDQSINNLALPITSAKGRYEGSTKIKSNCTSISYTQYEKFPLEENFYLDFSNLDNFIMDKVLGFGAYATVKLAKFKGDDKYYAIKVYEKYKITDTKKLKNVQKECAILKELNHSSIIKLYSCIENKRQINLVMEYVSALNLLQFLRMQPQRRLPEDQVKMIMYQLIEAVAYLHQRNIVHRDIKLDNIVIEEPSLQVKLIDFGFAANFPDDYRVSIYCGTPAYMAPEISSKQNYYPKPTDIWALGIVLYYMLLGTFPFKGFDEKEILRAIHKGNLEIPDTVSVHAKNLILKLLEQDPKIRITAAKALEHEWFSE